MDFSQIAMSEEEIKLLKEAKEDSIPMPRQNFERLIQHDFVTLDGVCEDKRFKIIATERGIDYLAYVESISEADKAARRHDWKIAIFSAFAGALLSDPLWSVLDWISDLVRQMLP